MAKSKKLKAESGPTDSATAFEHDLRFAADFSNEYSGHQCAAGEQLSRVSPSIAAEAFFEQFVKTRRPCIIEGLFDDESWRRDVWEPASLTARAGQERVKVEALDDEHRHFGLGNEQQMVFGDFVGRWSNGDCTLYMTTQDLDCDEEGRPFLTAPPVSSLIGDFPWSPRMAGNLVLQTINLWMGCSEKPMTSGLHHDFHDNFYLLLVGSKRFRLFPPSAAEHLYLVGSLAQVHANGRINFEGQRTTADGVSDDALRAYEASLKLETAAEADDSEVEAALEELLDAEHDDFDDGDDFDDDDFDDNENDEDDEGEDEDQGHLHPTSNGTKRPRGCEPKESGKPTKPNNFSRIDLAQQRDEIVRQFPRFAEVADTMIESTLRAGEMLYLPAGWFHEVSSFGASTESTVQPQHMALNYWFHPPDNDLFERPYKSGFWPKDWRDRVEMGLR